MHLYGNIRVRISILKCNDFSSEIEALIAEKRKKSYGYIVVVNYNGTKKQWHDVQKHYTYNFYNAAAIVAKCKDGETV